MQYNYSKPLSTLPKEATLSDIIASVNEIIEFINLSNFPDPKIEEELNNLGL
jgi:hypothetical protein